MPLRQLHPPQSTSAGDDGSLVDIIAVHGLNPKNKPVKEHAWDTWRSPSGEDGKLWLRDDLPDTVPDARIFLYEYDSRVAFTQDRKTFVDTVNLFLEDVRLKRRRTPRRPLLLMGHSLGGLLIKQALVHAFNNEKYEDIKIATQGLVFFATPHSGAQGSLVSIGKIAAKITSSLGAREGNNIVEIMNKDSMFSDLVNELYRQRLLDYPIVSFWGAFDKIVTKESASFGLPGRHESIVPLDADHSGVCKFGHSQDDVDNLERVQGNVLDLYEEAVAKVEEQVDISNQMKEELTTFLRLLYDPTYASIKDQNPRRVEGTCEWFTNHRRFKGWMDKTSALLWVSADPGCGKSVLSRYIADELVPPSPSRVACYFFFKDGIEQQQTAAGAIRCLLRQIFEQRPALASQALQKRFKDKDDQTLRSFRQLWDILLEVSQNLKNGRIVCILDALDECQDADQPLLLKSLSKLYLEQRERPRLSFIVTSRPYRNIRLELHDLVAEFPAILLSGGEQEEADQIAHEIDLVIAARVALIANRHHLTSVEAKTLMKAMTKHSNRTYLWVYLIFEEMDRKWVEWTPTQIQQQIQHPPSSIEEAYESMLSRSLHAEKARKLLHIVLAATRPLTLLELAIATAIGDRCNAARELDLDNLERFRLKIRDLCGLLVTVTNDKVYFIHQTAVEFLTKPATGFVDTASAWKQSLSPTESHSILGSACVRYLLYRDVQEHLDACFEADHLEESFQQAFDRFSFHRINSPTPDMRLILGGYAFKNWHCHLRHTDYRFLLENVLQLCQRSSKIPWRGQFYYARNNDESPLVIASILGLSHATRYLLDDPTTDVNVAVGYLEWTALELAAQQGHESVVQTFIDAENRHLKGHMEGLPSSNRIKFNATFPDDKHSDSPLSYAVNSCRLNVVQMLLNSGLVRVDCCSITTAMNGAYDDILKLLLKRSAASVLVEGVPGALEGLLGRAAGNNDVELMKILIDIKRPDAGDLGEALITASTDGFEEATTFLLQIEYVDVNFLDEDGATALFYAAVWGRESILQQLLAHPKIDIGHRDCGGRTALSWAAEKGSHDVIEQLLQRAPSTVNIGDNSGRTPLSWCANRRCRNSVGVYIRL